MAKQLYVKLQSPSIELQVKAEDSSETKAILTVGFKRFEAAETDTKLETLQTLLGEHLELLQKKQDKEAVDVSDMAEATKAVTDFIKDHIVYIKKAKLDMVDEQDKESELIIPDTRKAKPVEDFWETAEECLAALLDMYLASSPWRSSFISSLQAALLNANYEDGKLKN